MGEMCVVGATFIRQDLPFRSRTMAQLRFLPVFGELHELVSYIWKFEPPGSPKLPEPMTVPKLNERGIVVSS